MRLALRHMRITRFLVAAAVVGGLFTGFGAKAALPNTNNILKSPTRATLYWYANDGRRYVFPNVQTFYSWFSSNDFKRVITVNDQEMTSLPLGGNVTYRGGAKLVKVTTDPRVYAVAQYGVLRWVTSANLAQQLYGSDWSRKVEDVPDAFFTNYTIGTPIYQAGDINVGNEYNAAQTPSENVRPTYLIPSYPPTIPDPAPSAFLGTINLTLGNSNPRIGDTSNLFAQVSNSSIPSSQLIIDLYDEYGTLLRSCEANTTCLHSLQITQGLTTRSYYARLRSNSAYSALSVESNRVTLALNGWSNGSGSSANDTLSISSSAASYVRINETFTITATVNNNGYASDGYIITIYDQNDMVVRTCYQARTCAVNASISTNNTSQRYYARASNSLSGRTLDTSRITMTANTNSSLSSATLSIITDRTSLGVNDHAVITTQLQNYSGETSGLHTELFDSFTAKRVGTCTGTIYCRFNIYPTAITSQNGTRFYAVTTNNSGARIQSDYTSMIVANTNSWNGGALAQGFTVSISPLQPRVGELYMVNAIITGLRVSADQITIDIYDSQLGQRQQCIGTTTCSYAATEWQSGTKDIYAIIRAYNGETMRSDNWRMSY